MSASTSAVAAASSSSGPVVYIDPTASTNGNGSLSSPINNWALVDWQPGTTYLQKAGTTYQGFVHVDANGTSSSPIVMGTYGSGDAAVIEGAVIFDGASHVTMSGFTVEGSPFAGIAIQGGSHDLVIDGNTVVNNTSGIWFGTDAGGNNIVSNNEVASNAQNGIAFQATPGSAGVENQVIGNQVHSNGWHGIDVYSNHVIVEDNVVHENGTQISGASGIHVHAWSAAENMGQYNVIRGNVSYENKDSGGNDGIGILLDHYTGNNLVADNVTFSNDGVGIAAYMSHDNVITGNTSFGNSLDSGGTHTVRAQFALNNEGGAALTYGNVVENNTAISDSASVAALYVDGSSAQGNNSFDQNSWVNTAGGNVYVYGAQSGSNETKFNTLAGIGTDTFDVSNTEATQAGDPGTTTDTATDGTTDTTGGTTGTTSDTPLEIRGDATGNVLVGDTSHDKVFGGAGSDTIDGGAGDDNLVGNTASDVIYGGPGDDKLYGSMGQDTLYGGTDDDLLFGGSASDSLSGGAGNDELYGSAGSDSLDGGAGNDYLNGATGADMIMGGSGDDTLVGSQGFDTLIGGAGNDSLAGGSLGDQLDGRSGNDTLNGGQGEDIFIFRDGGDVDVIQDFEVLQDTLLLDANLWSGNLSGSDVIASFADVVAGNAVLAFGNGDTITLEGVTDLTALAGSIDFL